MPVGSIVLTMIPLLVAIAAAIGLIARIVPAPTEHALGATAAALVGFVIFQSIAGLVFLISNALRIRGGYVSRVRTLDLRLTRLWLDYTALSGLLALGLFVALPALVGTLELHP